MGYVREGEQWVRPGARNVEWIESVRRAGRALSFHVAVEDDAEREFLDDLAWRFRRMSWFLWRLTEGQVFLDQITIVDRSADGQFVIEYGKLDLTLRQGGGAVCLRPGTRQWQVRSAGRVYTRILTHEFLHGVLGLPDERHGCSCLMQGGLFGIRTDQIALCDSRTHRPSEVTPTSCWDLILERLPDFVHPNPVDYGRPPEVNLRIIDR